MGYLPSLFCVRRFAPLAVAILACLGVFFGFGFVPEAHAVDRYWVGGAGNFTDNANHWSATTGGSPGASKPVSTDTVYFDANSGNGSFTVTVDTAQQNVQYLNLTNANITIATTFLLQAAQGTHTINGTITGATNGFQPRRGSTVVGTGTISKLSTWGATGPTGFTIGTDTTTTLTIQEINGFTGFTYTNNGNITIGSFNTFTNTTWLDAANSTLNYTGAAAPGWQALSASEAGTINYSASGDQSIVVATTYYNLSTSGTGIKSLAGNITVNNNFTVGSGTTFDPFSSSTNRTLTGVAGKSFTVNGTLKVRANTFAGSYPTWNTFSFNTNSTVNYVGASPTIDATKTYYNLTFSGTGTAVLSGDTNNINGAFSVTAATFSQGAYDMTVAGNFVLSASTTFTKATNSKTLYLSSTGNLTDSNASKQDLGDVIISGGTRTMTSATRMTSLTINSGTTFDPLVNASTISGAVTVSGQIKVGAATFGDNYTDGASPKVPTLNAASTVHYCKAGDQTVSSGFSYANSNLVFSAGGTKTLAGDVVVGVNLTIGTGTTLDVSASNFALSVTGNWANSGTFNGRSGTVTFNGTTQTVSGTTTFNNLTIDKTNSPTISFTSDTTQTIGGTFTATGDVTHQITIGATTTSAATLSKSSGTVSVSYCTLSYSTATGGATWQAYTANGNINGGNNSGWMFTAPDAYWVGGTGNWSDATNHWASASNGTPSASNLPGASTNVHFDTNSGTGTVTINSADVTVANFDESSSNITVDTSTNGITVSGNMTVNNNISGTGAVTFSGTGKTITAGGGGLFSAPLTLGADLTVNVAAVYSISGTISGNYALYKTGAGQLNVEGNNTFTGGLTIKAGILHCGTNNNPLGGSGTGTVVLGDSSGTASATLACNGFTFANPITVASGSSGTLSMSGGTVGSPTFSGAITLNNNLSVVTDTKDITLSGSISGTGNITISTSDTNIATLSGSSINHTGTITNSGSGSGTTTISGVIGSNVTGITQNSATSKLLLSGNNSTVGAVTISAGTLETSGTTNINVSGDWSNAGTFTPNSGTVTFTGSGTQTLNSGGTGAGKQFNNLSFTGAGTFQPVTYDIHVNGTLTVSNGTINKTAGALTITANTINQTGGEIKTTTSGALAIQSTGAVGNFVLSTITSAGTLSIGTTTAPASVTANGVLTSAALMTIKSNSDITQNANINSGTTNATFYPDVDNSGTATFTHTSGTITADNTYFYFPSGATTAFTLAGLDSSAGTTNAIDIGAAAGTSPASVNITGDVTSNDSIIVRSLGDITQNANITANAGANTVNFYPDIDNNSATSTFTYTSGVSTASDTLFYFPASSVTAFTITGANASAGTTNRILIGANSATAPASVNVTGTLTGNNNILIYSLGDVTQNANITAAVGSLVGINVDQDNSGSATFTRTSGDISGSAGIYFYSQSTTALTIAGFSVTSGGILYFGDAAGNSPASINITGDITGANSQIQFRSRGDITQNANITANGGAGNVYIYPDVDNNSASSTFTHTSGTITANITSFYFPASSATAFTLAGLDSSLGTTNAVSIGTSASTAPASISITGTVTSNDQIIIYSLSDITQNANIIANAGGSGTTIYPDADNNSATATFTHTSGTITASAANFSFQNGATASFTLAGLDCSAASAIGLGGGSSSTSVNITGNVTTGGTLNIRSLGDITQNANITVDSGNSAINIYPDMDNNSATSTFTHTSGTITASTTSVLFQASSTTAFTLAGLDASAGSTNSVIIGSTSGTAAASVNITGAVAGNATIAVRALGDIYQGAALTTSPATTISLYPNLAVSTNKAYISNNSTITGTTYTVNGDLTINADKTLNANGTGITVTGAYDNLGILQVKGSETLTLTNDTNSGTTTYVGNSGSSTFNVSDFGDNDYYHLTINGAAAEIFQLQNPLTVLGNLTISGGTLDANAQAINVAGTWNNTATYTANGNTVTLNGTNQSVLGTTTFNNLVKTVVSAATLTFEATKTQVIAGALTLQGALRNLLSLVSSVPGINWLIQPNAVQTNTVDYASIQDSTVSGSVLSATNSQNKTPSTNVNWSFAATTVTWTGATSTEWTTDSNWDVGYMPNTTDNVVIANTARIPTLTSAHTANNLTIQSGATLNLNGQNITLTGSFTNWGTLKLQGSETLTGFTNDINNGGTVEYTNPANAFPNASVGLSHAGLSFSGSGTWTLGTAPTFTSLNIASGTTLDANGKTLTFGTFTNYGTFRLRNTETLNNFTNDVSNGGTIQYYSGSAINSLLTGYSSYANLEFNASGQTITLPQSLSMSGNLVLTQGALNLNGHDLTLAGLTRTSGTLTGTSSQIITINNGGSSFNPGEITIGTLNLTNTAGNGTTTVGSNFTATTLSIGVQRTLSITDYTVSAPSFTNLGTLTENGTGNIRHDSTSLLITDSNFDTAPVISVPDDPLYITIDDADGNVDASTPDTLTVIATCQYDSENVTLTETGNATGVFRNSGLTTALYSGSATNNNGTLTCSDSESISVEYTDPEDSADTQSTSATATTTAPNAPSNFSGAAQSTTSILWTWTDNSNNESGFKLLNGSNGLVYTTANNVVSYLETGLTPGTSYTRKIQAYNPKGTAVSSEATITTPSAPTAPSLLSGTALNDTTITWTWTDNSDNETGFKLYSSTNTLIATVSGTNTYTETQLTAGTTYSRYVLAYNSYGNSANSNTATATTDEAQVSVAATINSAELLTPADGSYLDTLMPTFSFRRIPNTDNGAATYTLTLDSGEKTIALGSIVQGGSNVLDKGILSGTADTITFKLRDVEFLSEGAHTWAIIGTDPLGVTKTSATRTFVVDITKASVMNVSVTPQTAGKVLSSSSKRPTFTFNTADNIGLRTIIFTLAKKNYLFGRQIGTTTVYTKTYTVDQTEDAFSIVPSKDLQVGDYILTITVNDMAGNTTSVTRNFAVVVSSRASASESDYPLAESTPPPSMAEIAERIKKGETPARAPESFQLPDLAKHARFYRDKQAMNFQAFLESFIPEPVLTAINTKVNYAFSALRQGTRLAMNTTVKTAYEVAANITDMPHSAFRAKQVAENTPFIPNLIVNTQKTAFNLLAYLNQVLITGRDNRLDLAVANESHVASALQPVRRAGQSIALGAIVGYEHFLGRDKQGLVISDVGITIIEKDRAQVSFNTNRLTKGKINYGTSPSYGHEVFINDFASHHDVILPKLSPNSKYYFEVLATDTNGKQTFDAYYSFVTKEE